MELFTKSVPSLLFRILAKRRRQQGEYNKDTKKLFQRAVELSPTAAARMDLIAFERDLGNAISRSDLEAIKSSFNRLSKRHRFLYLNFLLETRQDIALEALIEQQVLLQLAEQSPPIADYCIRQQWSVSENAAALAMLNNQQNQWRQEFLEWLQINDHDVAIVGNAASIKKSQSGKQIDQHRIVTRFNNFLDLASCYQATGEKLDIWVHSPGFDPKTKEIKAKIPWIVITGPDVQYMLSNWQSWLPFLRQGSRVLSIPLNCWKPLVNELEAPPSAGILFVAWMNHLLSKGQKSAVLYGFQYQAKNFGQAHVQVKNKTSRRHNWNSECRLFEEWDAQKKCKTVNKPDCSNQLQQQFYTAGVFSAGLKVRKKLLQALDVKRVIWRPHRWQTKPDLVIGWGRKKNTRRARKYAKLRQLPYIALEDGFLHSVGKGGLSGGDGVSVVVDKTGIYYDATCPSDLEILLQEEKGNQPVYLERARKCIELILKHNLSKYNAATVELSELNLPAGKKVLVVDQTEGDMSLKYGYVSDATFKKMLGAALEEHPNAHIVVKTHARVSAGNKKRGCLSRIPSHPRLMLVDENVNPVKLIKTMSHVYVASSQMGFEALMAGKPVTCFGVPFYAQWGLTDDRGVRVERRQRKISLEELFVASYILYTRYIHPKTGKRCEVEDILESFIKETLIKT